MILTNLRLYIFKKATWLMFAVVLCTVNSLTVPAAQALNGVYDTEFYSGNNIARYCPAPNESGTVSSSGTSTGGTTSGGAVGADTSSVEKYIQAYGQAAFDIGKQYGIPYEAILAQSALESGWGSSGLTVNAFNFFGIKAGSSWTGATYNAQTQEQSPSGSVSTISADFRAYGSAAESFSDYATLITTASRYADALNYPGDPVAYITAIREAGYATDVNYVSKVSSIITSMTAYIQANNLWPPSSEVTPDASAPISTATGATAGMTGGTPAYTFCAADGIHTSPATGGVGTAATGSTTGTFTGATSSILDGAYTFAGIRYATGGGHAGSAETAAANAQSTGLDCSGLVRVAIYVATGIDIGSLTANGISTSSMFTEVPAAEAQPGDIWWRSSGGHVEVVETNNTSTQIITTYGAHSYSYPTVSTSSLIKDYNDGKILRFNG